MTAPRTRPLLVLVTALAAVVSACDGGQGPSAPSPPTPTAPAVPSPTVSAPPPAAPTTVPQAPPDTPDPRPTMTPEPLPGDVAPVWQAVAEGFEGPLQVLADPRDGSTLVVERPGRIRTLDGDTLLDLTDRVTTAGREQGLLGAAFHPDGDRLFVHYSGDGGQTTLSEFPATAGPIDAGSETVLLTHPQPARNHNGGAVLFGSDGALYLALGDGGAAGDRFGNGQDPSTLLGAILRLDASEPGTVRPADGNPFLDGGGAPEVWMYGLRNPWRIWFDAGLLYVADVGQDAVEEVTVLPDDAGGANLGWPILEGSRCFRDANCDADGTVLPQVELLHENGAASVIGGVVYRGSALPELIGHYLFTDLADGRLRTLLVDEAQQVVDERVFDGAAVERPLGFGVDADGEVHLGAASGTIYRLAGG